MKKIWIISALLATVMMSGCGSSSAKETVENNDFKGKTLIFFDNKTSKQFSYDGTHQEAKDMNIEGQTQDMRGKNGKLIFWEDGEQKAVMLKDTFSIENGDLTAEDIHYVGELDAEELTIHSDLAELEALNMHLKEQVEEREEISEALTKITKGSETLCNFFILGHHEHADEEKVPHIVLTQSGKVYILEETEEGLGSTQVPFALDGVTDCSKERSNIVEYDEDGVLIFSAQSQKIYLVDSHDADFHAHSTTNISELLPKGIHPTQCVAIGEAEGHEHNDDH